MRYIFTFVCVAALPFVSSFAHAEQVGNLQIEADGRGFVSFSNYRLSQESSYGRELHVLNFEMRIISRPPCDRVMIHFDLDTPSGATIVKGLMAGPTPIYIRQGESYVTAIKRSGLDKAGRMRLWPQCSAVR